MYKANIIAYCRQNLGDDLFVRTLVRRYPNIQFTCHIPPSCNDAFRMETNLKSPGAILVFFQRLLNKLKILPLQQVRRIMARNSDLVIRIGGSIFIEQQDSCNRDWRPFHKNEFVIGANFGPYYTDSFFGDAASFFSRCTDICFRDRYSYNLFSHLNQVRFAPDVLFGYPYYPQSCSGYGVAISAISIENRPEIEEIGEKYYTILGKVCDIFVEKNLPVKLFSFCSAEGDLKAIEEILKRAKHRDQISTSIYSGNIDEILSEINECEYMIATRFHAMVLAWAMKKRVLPIVYSPKQTHVLEDLGYDGFCWNLLCEDIPDPEQVVKYCQEAGPLETAENLVKEAQKQFSALDAFVKEM